MPILPLVAFIIVVAALAGVWRARGRGANAMQSSIMLLIVALAAAVAIWFLLPRL
jgi:hypothetical protein